MNRILKTGGTFPKMKIASAYIPLKPKTALLIDLLLISEEESFGFLLFASKPPKLRNFDGAVSGNTARFDAKIVDQS